MTSFPALVARALYERSDALVAQAKTGASEQHEVRREAAMELALALSVHDLRGAKLTGCLEGCLRCADLAVSHARFASSPRDWIRCGQELEAASRMADDLPSVTRDMMMSVLRELRELCIRGADRRVA